MTRGEVEYAVRKAHEQFDQWNDVTGCIPKLTGHYYEVLAVVEDAVNIGAMVALGIPLMVNDCGELVIPPGVVAEPLSRQGADHA